ncbi:MAG: hypothetical protein ACE14S_02420 [Candidatus Bathyarchaeia archaeon]
METALNYNLTDERRSLKAEGEAKATLDEKYLTLAPESGETLLFAYTDITGILEEDYQITLYLSSRETLNLSGLGYRYEDFLRELFRLRNELLLKYMLMDETLLQAGYGAQFRWLNQKGQVVQLGDCEVRLYETALLVLPQKGEPIRQPYSFITQTGKADYRLTVTDESGEKVEFSMLGEKFDALSKGLADALNRMMLRSQATVKELVPEANPATVSKLAALMKDGRAARRKDMDALSPELWLRLTKRIQEAGLGEEYSFLDAMAVKDEVSAGVKRGLMGDLTGSYVWLLVPLQRTGQTKLENAVALEAFQIDEDNAQEREIGAEAAENGDTQTADEAGKAASGKATYFFRIMNPTAYAQATAENASNELESFLKSVNRCMVDINFRREPIYLTEDALASPKYVQYRYAVAKLPSLQKLRRQFIGRVIHTSPEQWKRDVTSLLAFNANSKDDHAKWTKGAEK